LTTAPKDRPKKRSEPEETVGRFEPALIDQVAPPITDLIADISNASATLGKALHPKTAAKDDGRRNLQLEAAAHVRVQKEVDRLAMDGQLPEPASREFIRWLHHEFYKGAPPAMLLVRSSRGRSFQMTPGKWRSKPEHDVTVGRHQPPRTIASITSTLSRTATVASPG
jgi:Fic family protein